MDVAELCAAVMATGERVFGAWRGEPEGRPPGWHGKDGLVTDQPGGRGDQGRVRPAAQRGR